MYNDIVIYCSLILFDKRGMSYLYTETYRLPVSDLDECTYICFCRVCTHHHHRYHHFRCLHNYSHYWTSLRKRGFLLNRNNKYCCPLWFSWKPFQYLNLHKCIYRAIIHVSVINKEIVPVVLFSLYWPLSLSMSIVVTSSSSSSLLQSPSSSLKSLLIWNYKLCSVTDLSLSECFF